MIDAVSCAHCGRVLDEDSGLPEDQRQPCSECGSLERHVDKFAQDSAAASESLSLGVQVGAGPRPWIELWLQVQHQLKTLQAMYAGQAGTAGSQQVQSTVNEFFINCYSLKDHIKNDPAVPPAVTAKVVEAFVHSTPALQLAGDIANTAKHHTLWSGRKAAISGWHAGPGGVTVEITATDATGSTTQDALVLAHDALAAWQQFITSNGLG